MVFRRRFNALRPVNRIKHVVDTQNATTAGTSQVEALVDAVDAPTLANPIQVQTGSTVNGIFLIVEVTASSSAALSNVYLMVYKNPGNNVALGSIPEPNVVGSSDFKKNVIHQEMIMLQQQTNSNPRTLFKGVIAIPRHMRRFAPDDILNYRILAPGVNINYCSQCHYKEFR